MSAGKSGRGEKSTKKRGRREGATECLAYAGGQNNTDVQAKRGETGRRI